MYSDEISYVNLQKTKQNFSVLSVNIQSLPAKFNEFQEFINSLQVKNAHPNVICLQEIWKLANSDMYTLKGYHPLVFKTRANNVQGGGVGLYVRSELNFSVLAVQSIFIDCIFESIMVEIEFSRDQKIVVGSLYRPGNHPVLTPKDQFNQFCDLLTNLFDNMNSSSKKFSYLVILILMFLSMEVTPKPRILLI
jgi:exonuclease III